MGIYLFSAGLIMLTPLRATSMTPIIPLVYPLRLVSPYVTLIVGSAWMILGWGLFRLHDWARVAAMTLLFVGVGLELVRVALVSSRSPSILIWGIFDISLRLVIVWYLFRAPTAEKFLKPTKPT